MPNTIHHAMPVVTARIWTGRYYEWISEAQCVCGWAISAENERVAEISAAEHVRICDAAAELTAR